MSPSRIAVTAEPDPLPSDPKPGDMHRQLGGIWRMWDGEKWFTVTPHAKDSKQP